MLEPYLQAVERRCKRFVVYGADDREVTDRLATRNVAVERRALPAAVPAPFVVVYDDGAFAGVLGFETLAELLVPPVIRPGDRTGLSDGYRVLLDVLAETLFSALDRRQLLATSREIEDRAFRVGRGTLRVGFQSLSVFETQTAVYRRLGAETDLSVHVYGRPDWTPPDIESVTYHLDEDGSLEPFWCLAFDGGGDDTQACALVARERADGYVGFWTYDSDLVEDVLSTLRAAD